MIADHNSVRLRPARSPRVETSMAARHRRLQVHAHHRAIMWVRPKSSSVVLSTTMGQTLLTVGFEKTGNVLTGDPGNFAGFSVHFDFPLLGGWKSMMILPIVNQSQDIITLPQCYCFQNAPAQVQSEFPQYYIDVLKIVSERKALSYQSWHFVPWFTPQGVKVLRKLSFMICHPLRLAKWLEVRRSEQDQMTCDMKLLRVQWETVKIAGAHFFECIS
jgi:hypothetical protein